MLIKEDWIISVHDLEEMFRDELKYREDEMRRLEKQLDQYKSNFSLNRQRPIRRRFNTTCCGKSKTAP